MIKLPFVLLYTAMTFIAWGVYGILLNKGQADMGSSFLKPFIGVGFAYFVIAVLGAGAMLGGRKEKGHWSFMGTIFSLVAGAVGALGALGVILALAFGGQPVYVMPLIFGGAPVVNTLFTSWLGKTFHKITPLFVIGMVLVALGMIGILRYKPHTAPKATATHAQVSTSVPLAVASFAADDTKAESAPKVEATTASEDSPAATPKTTSWVVVFLSIIMAICCWGSYGPVLHLGQMRMGGSRMRPFICVGLAYFVIAVALPLSMLAIDRPGSEWTLSGSLWSIAAGTAGAIGALGIILAFNSGGKPIFVMPLVFGFAPVINTIVSLWLANQLHTVDPVFAASLATIIGGAVMVLVFAPKSGHGPAKPHEDEKLAPKPATPIPSPPPATSAVTSSVSVESSVPMASPVPAASLTANDGDTTAPPSTSGLGNNDSTTEPKP